MDGNGVLGNCSIGRVGGTAMRLCVILRGSHKHVQYNILARFNTRPSCETQTANFHRVEGSLRRSYRGIPTWVFEWHSSTVRSFRSLASRRTRTVRFFSGSRRRCYLHSGNLDLAGSGSAAHANGGTIAPPRPKFDRGRGRETTNARKYN